MGDERLQGAPSDVVFEIVEISDRLFKRDGNDLRMSMEITLEEVICILFRQSWDSKKLSSTWMVGSLL